MSTCTKALRLIGATIESDM